METASVPYSALPKMWAGAAPTLNRLIPRLTKAFDCHGDTVRLTGLPVRVVCTRCPTLCRQILTHKSVGQTKSSWLMPRVQRVMGTGAYVDAGGDGWRRKRQSVQGAFVQEQIPRVRKITHQVVSRHLELWDEPARHGAPFDIYQPLQRLIIDLSFRLFFSHDLGDQLENVRKNTHTIETRFAWILPLWLPIPANFQFEKARQELYQVMSAIVRDRQRQQASPYGDLLDILVSARHPETDQAWSVDEIVGEMYSVYFGASVMSATLAWALVCLARESELQHRFASATAAVNENDVEGLASLPLSQQIFKETARLFPASWGYPRYAEEAAQIGALEVPSRTVLVPLIYHAHRHPRYWTQPYDFYPARFDSISPAEELERGYLPFGAGQRKCAGATIAPSLLQTAIGLLVRRYEYTLGGTDWDYQPDFGFEILPRHHVPLRIRKRVPLPLDARADLVLSEV